MRVGVKDVSLAVLTGQVKTKESAHWPVFLFISHLPDTNRGGEKRTHKDEDFHSISLRGIHTGGLVSLQVSRFVAGRVPMTINEWPVEACWCSCRFQVAFRLIELEPSEKILGQVSEANSVGSVARAKPHLASGFVRWHAFVVLKFGPAGRRASSKSHTHQTRRPHSVAQRSADFGSASAMPTPSNEWPSLLRVQRRSSLLCTAGCVYGRRRRRR